jgi:hypothetical protein
VKTVRFGLSVFFPPGPHLLIYNSELEQTDKIDSFQGDHAESMKRDNFKNSNAKEQHLMSSHLNTQSEQTVKK